MRIVAALPTMMVMTFATAQHHTNDRWSTLLDTAASDSARVRILLRIAGDQLANNTDSAFTLLQHARFFALRSSSSDDIGEVHGWLGYVEEQRGHIADAIAHYDTSMAECERLHDRRGLAVVLNNLAAIHKDQGHIDEALAAHRRSLSIRQELHDSAGIATSLNNIGLIEYDQGRIPDAMAHYAEALRLYEHLHVNDGISTVLHNIAGIYRDQGDPSEALSYFNRALLIERGTHDLYNAASTEDNIGELLASQGRSEPAMTHFRLALALHDSVDDQRGIGYSLRNIANEELRRNNAPSAFAAAKEALAHFDASDDKRGRASALWVMGSAQARLGDETEATRLASEALTLARALGYPQLVRDAAQLLGQLYRDAHRWQDALAMQDLYHTMRDSVLNQDTRRASIRQQYAYTYEKKEAALKAEQAEHDLRASIRLQQEKNRRNVFLLLGAGVLVLAIGLWTRLRYVRRSRAAIQKEKDVSDELLLNILPEEVARELKEKGEAEAKHFDQVTILFSDFKGFTSVSEKLSPQELVEELNTCFKAFDHIITARGIEKIKTIGDAYMCAGGLPDPKTSTPADVVHAALEMQAFMKARKTERQAQGKPAFEMRIGIHSGPVVAGIVGVKKFQYDIWGDTVNTASRMESSGEVGQVNISGATFALVRAASTPPGRAAFTFTSRGKVQAKGKGEMEMYFVEAAGWIPRIDATRATS